MPPRMAAVNASATAAQAVDSARTRILRFFRASPERFDVVFVPNATAAMKIVGEAARDAAGAVEWDSEGPAEVADGADMWSGRTGVGEKERETDAKAKREGKKKSFWYGYHVDSHTSAVGVRELAGSSRCFVEDGEVDAWINRRLAVGDEASDEEGDEDSPFGLFEFPGQSNMSGRRLPLDWCRRIRASATTNHGCARPCYTLLDAASLVSTSSLDLSDADAAPDFVAVSFYKIFGFPDLGALLVRNEAAPLLARRRYFGGGTVSLVVATGEKGGEWHVKHGDDGGSISRKKGGKGCKEGTYGCDSDTRFTGPIHAAVEDGTLPIHSIVALHAALDAHGRLYGDMANVSKHTAALAADMHTRLKGLRHWNGVPLVRAFYNAEPASAVGEGEGNNGNTSSIYTRTTQQGPIVTFNLQTSARTWLPPAAIAQLAATAPGPTATTTTVTRNDDGIQLRAGALCNPGGTARAMGLSAADLRRNYAAGYRCDGSGGVLNGRPTGALRASLGAMSCQREVERLVEFLEDVFVDRPPASVSGPAGMDMDMKKGGEGMGNGAGTGEKGCISTKDIVTTSPYSRPHPSSPSSSLPFYIDALCIYPIKSCAAFRIPPRVPWQIRPDGLAWDREWCLVHRGSGAALTMKRYPRMALIRPVVDVAKGVLRVELDRQQRSGRECGGEYSGDRESAGKQEDDETLEIPLYEPGYACGSNAQAEKPTTLCDPAMASQLGTVCGNRVSVQVYSASAVADFFSDFLDVPCTLARCPAEGVVRKGIGTGSLKPRNKGEESQVRQVETEAQKLPPGAWPGQEVEEREGKKNVDGEKGANDDDEKATGPKNQRSMKLANESPMLLVSRSSVNRLNELIKANHASATSLVNQSPPTPNSSPSSTLNAAARAPPRTVAADVFRANIIVAEQPPYLDSNSTLDSTIVVQEQLKKPHHQQHQQYQQRQEHPYLEDRWQALRIVPDSAGTTNTYALAVRLDVLGSCQRCQMVCIDQATGVRGQEPLATLARTRRVGGKLLFGRHVRLTTVESNDQDWPVVRVGDVVWPEYGDDDG